MNGALAAPGRATSAQPIGRLSPVYGKQLAGINPVELIAHRHFWSLLFVLGFVIAQHRGGEIRAALGTRRAIGVNLLSASALTFNWLLFTSRSRATGSSVSASSGPRWCCTPWTMSSRNVARHRPSSFSHP